MDLEPSYFYRVWLKAAQEAESELMKVLPAIPRKNEESLLDYMDRIDWIRRARVRDLLAAVEELKKQGGTYPL